MNFVQKYTMGYSEYILSGEKNSSSDISGLQDIPSVHMWLHYMLFFFFSKADVFNFISSDKIQPEPVNIK